MVEDKAQGFPAPHRPAFATSPKTPCCRCCMMRLRRPNDASSCFHTSCGTCRCLPFNVLLHPAMLKRCGIAEGCNRFRDDGHIDSNRLSTHWGASSFKPRKDLAPMISSWRYEKADAKGSRTSNASEKSQGISQGRSHVRTASWLKL